MSVRIVQLGLVAAALGASATAFAAATIVGGGSARECYYAAEFNRPVKPSLEVCTVALEAEALSQEQQASTLVNRGIVYMHAKNLTAALADYERALKLRPDLAEALVNKGIALVHLGGHDEEAITMLSAGIELSPNRPEVAYYTRAIAYELTGQTKEAYEDYKKAAELRPDWTEAIAQLQRFTVVRKPTAGV